MSSDELFSGGGDGGWKGGANKNKRQKVPGRGPGVAQLEKIMRLGDDCDTTSTRACAFTFPSHYAPPPPPHPPVMGFGPPPLPMPRGFFSTDDKSKQIFAHPQYSPSQPLTPVTNPPFWHIVQPSPSTNGLITVEPPSNQRFNQRTNSSLQPHQGPIVCNHQHPNPFSDHTTTNTCLHEINPSPLFRETNTNMVKWGVSECGSSFQGSTTNESRSCRRHVVPFYNFIQPKEYLKERDEVEEGGMDLDLDLKL